MIKLRIRFPPSNPILEIEKNETFGNLRNRISELVDLDAESFTLMNGFPPREILCGDSNKVIDFLCDGDAVIIQPHQLSGKQAMSHRKVPKSLSSTAAPSFCSPSCTPIKRKNYTTGTGMERGEGLVHTIYSTPTKQIRKKKKKNDNENENTCISDKEKWAENLMHVFTSKSGDLSSAEKCLKGSFKNLVKKRYRSTLAEQRWSSVSGLTYEIKNLENFKFEVTFPISNRKHIKETYVAFPKVLLGAVLREVYESGNENARHNLRPYYMAEAHPTIFWNIVRHFSGNFFGGLENLVPQIDWSFAFDRKRDLSEKAMENLRQKKENEERKIAAKKVKEEKLRKKTSKEIPSETETEETKIEYGKKGEEEKADQLQKKEETKYLEVEEKEAKNQPKQEEKTNEYKTEPYIQTELQK